ncbi:hypothetical protein P9112_006502 [Eukaryota sp. TZLM1-RC]
MDRLQALLSEDPHASVVDLSNCDIKGVGPLTSLLGQFTSLTHLVLSNNHVSSLPEDLSHCLPHLRTLDISYNPIENVHSVLPGLQSLPKLRHLFINLPDEEQEDEVIVTLIYLRTFNNVQLPEADESEDEEQVADTPKMLSANSNPNFNPKPTPTPNPPPANEVTMDPLNDYELPLLADLYTRICSMIGYQDDSIFESHCSDVFKNQADLNGKVKDVQAQEALFDLCRLELFSVLFKPICQVLSKNSPEVGSIVRTIFDRVSRATSSITSSVTSSVSDLVQKLGSARESLLAAERETTDLLHAAELLEQETKTHRNERQAVMNQFEKEKRQLREEIGLLKVENEKLNIRVRQLSTQQARRAQKEGQITSSRSEVIEVKDSPREVKKNHSDDDLVRAKSMISSLMATAPKPTVSKHRDLTLKQTTELIEEIWESKVKTDKRNLNAKIPLETLNEHIFSYLNTKYGLPSLVMEMAGALTNAIHRYKTQSNFIAVFFHTLRSEIDEEFRHVQTQLEKTVNELLRAQLRVKNPYLSERDLSIKVKKKVKGFLSEEEWVDVISYLYAHEDAVSVTMKVKLEVQRTNPKPKSLSPATRLRLQQLQTVGRLDQHDEETRVALNPSEASKISYDNFLKVLLDFQLDGHLKFLSNFVVLFKKVDGDLDGAIFEAEFIELMKLLDNSKSQIQITNAINQFDPHGIGRFTFSQCVQFLSNELVKET